MGAPKTSLSQSVRSEAQYRSIVTRSAPSERSMIVPSARIRPAQLRWMPSKSRDIRSQSGITTSAFVRAARLEETVANVRTRRRR